MRCAGATGGTGIIFVVMSLLATAFYYLAFAKGAALLLSSVAGMLSGAILLFTFVTAFGFLICCKMSWNELERRLR